MGIGETFGRLVDPEDPSPGRFRVVGILAGEPTAFLDHPTGHAVMDVLRGEVGRAALVVVTHDPEMLAGATRVLHLRDGWLEEQGAGPG